MFVLTNTAGASATTPPASKTTLFVDASGVPSTKSSGGTVTPLLTGPAAAAAYQPLDADLTGIAGLTYAADKSIYYNGSAWATYDLTGVGRTLLAATTQAALRGVLGTGTPSSANFLRGDGAWSSEIEGSFFLTGAAGGTRSFKIGASRTADGFSTFDLITDSTYTNYGFRVSRAGGANGATVLTARGTGGYALTTEEQGGIVLRTNNTVALNISGFTQNVSWSTTLLPAADNASDIGTGAIRVRTYYGVNAAINTSDARLKTDPRQLRDAEFKAASAIARLPAVWRWLSRVHGDENCEPEGREARKHFGPTVQAAIAVMEAHGLDPFAYSFICYDEWEALPEQWHEWEAQEAVLDDDGNEIEPAVEAGRELVQEARDAGDRYSFRKEELLCFIVRALAQELDGLSERVAALEAARTP